MENIETRNALLMVLTTNVLCASKSDRDNIIEGNTPRLIIAVTDSILIH